MPGPQSLGTLRPPSAHACSVTTHSGQAGSRANLSVDACKVHNGSKPSRSRRTQSVARCRGPWSTRPPGPLLSARPPGFSLGKRHLQTALGEACRLSIPPWPGQFQQQSDFTARQCTQERPGAALHAHLPWSPPSGPRGRLHCRLRGHMQHPSV